MDGQLKIIKPISSTEVIYRPMEEKQIKIDILKYFE